MSSEYVLSFVGAGRVGLPYAVVFASKGFKVYVYDIDDEKRNLIRQGLAPFFEPGLDDLLKEAVRSGNLVVGDSVAEVVKQSYVTFIVVGTPGNRDGTVNLEYIEKASRDIAEALKHKDGWHLVVVKSTVPPGTTRNLVKNTIEKVSGKRNAKDFGVVYNPEFLSQGSAIHNILYPDRIIIGELDKMSGDVMENIYRKLHSDKIPPIIRTTPENAELIKYASNVYLAMKISFANMIARLCEKIPGADATVVLKGVGLDKRIGPHYLAPGLSWGGNCFPKDLKAMLYVGRELGVDLPLIRATIEINETQSLKPVEFAEELLGSVSGKRICVLGLSYKPNTDDITNSPSIAIINNLLTKGAKVVVYDPRAIANTKKVFGNKIEYASSAVECLKDSDCVIIATEWDEFKKLTPEVFLKHMKNAIVIDGRRIYDPDAMIRHGIKFKAIGLGQNHPVIIVKE